MFFKTKKARLQQLVNEVPFWFHTIDLGHGVQTPGRKPTENLESELVALHLPSLGGKSVLDVGAWDGYFSFAAERLGARRVVALDHYVWSMDLAAQVEYWQECREKRILPAPYETLPHIWRPEELPGKRGFDTAREALGSRVEARVADLMDTDLDELGTFDVVLYKGVLYHLEDPLKGLRRVAAVTAERAIIETAAVLVPGFEDSALCELYPFDELAGDPTNWWAPNETALHGLCRAVGFDRVETVFRSPHAVEPVGGDRVRYRIVVHALRQAA